MRDFSTEAHGVDDASATAVVGPSNLPVAGVGVTTSPGTTVVTTGLLARVSGVVRAGYRRLNGYLAQRVVFYD